MLSEEIILVVEDDVALAEGLRRTLRVDGLETHVASDGIQALAWLEDHTPALILADIAMPNMNGYQLFQRLRQRPEWVRIPFIFLTARAEVEDIRYGKELGVDDYLTKPIEPHDLLAAIRGKLTRFEELGSGQPEPISVVGSGVYRVNLLEVDLARRLIRVDGLEDSLPPTAFDVLQRLILAGGRTVPYEDLIGGDDLSDASDAAERLRYHIRDLRHKLREMGEAQDLIANVRGVGYRLVIEPVRLTAP